VESVVVDRGGLQNVFSDCIYSGVRMIDRQFHGHVFPSLLLRKHDRQANGCTHGKKSVGVGSDGAIKIISLYFIHTHILSC